MTDSTRNYDMKLISESVHTPPPHTLHRNASPRRSSSSITLKTVESEHDLMRYQEMVYTSFCIERDWLNATDYPDRRVTDCYDPFSDMIMVERGEKIVAGMRLVGDSPLHFPHEHLCKFYLPLENVEADEAVMRKLANLRRTDIREVSRFASVGLGMRGSSMTVELVKGLYWYALNKGLGAYFMVIDLDLLNLCNKIHIPIHRIGDDFYCEGSMVMPGVLFPDEMSAMQKRKRIWNHILNQEGLSHTLSQQNIAA